ncbi:MAG TPA: hypothetical protein VF220_00905 [Nitrososphaeraceae archaeon]
MREDDKAEAEPDHVQKGSDSSEDINSDKDLQDSKQESSNASQGEHSGESIKSTSKITDKVEDYDLIVSSLKDATTSFKEAIFSIGKRAHEFKDKAEETFTVGVKKDAREIQSLGRYVESVIKGYEDTMAEINKRNYADQERLLKGYKKLLEEQINMINARIGLVKRLKATK